jgi:hypothetical protein
MRAPISVTFTTPYKAKRSRLKSQKRSHGLSPNCFSRAYIHIIPQLSARVKASHCLSKNVHETVSLPHLKNVHETGGEDMVVS